MQENHAAYFENAAEACIECGLCTRIQEQSGCYELTYADFARAMIEAMNSGDYENVTDPAWSCTLCGACTARCPAHISAYDFVRHVRCVLNPEQPGIVGEFAPMRPDLETNSYRRLRAIREPLLPDAFDGEGACSKLFFPGCSLGTYAPELARDVYNHLHESYDVDGITYLCCGNPYYLMGDMQLSRQWASDLSQKLNARGVEQIIVTCPSCYAMLCTYREQGLLAESLTITALPVVLADQGMRIDPNVAKDAGFDSLSIKDACRDRSSSIFATSVRQILSDVDVVELKHNRRDSRCCGSGGLVPLYDEETSEDKRWSLLDEFDDSGASCLITTCMNCSFALRQNGDTNIMHYLELLFGQPVDWERLANDTQAMLAR